MFYTLKTILCSAFGLITQSLIVMMIPCNISNKILSWFFLRIILHFPSEKWVCSGPSDGLLYSSERLLRWRGCWAAGEWPGWWGRSLSGSCWPGTSREYSALPLLSHREFRVLPAELWSISPTVRWSERELLRRQRVNMVGGSSVFDSWEIWPSLWRYCGQPEHDNIGCSLEVQ